MARHGTSVNPRTTTGRIWGCTDCNFDASGHGDCLTGNCTSGLECTGWGTPPNTFAEFAVNQFTNLDFYDISLVDGFNIPMDFTPLNSVCAKSSCKADINGHCPKVLRVPGGCNNPCTMFKTDEYCCFKGPGSCAPTAYSRFFLVKCPDAYSFPRDDPTRTFICPTGSNYRVVFCPSRSSLVNLEMPASL